MSMPTPPAETSSPLTDASPDVLFDIPSDRSGRTRLAALLVLAIVAACGAAAWFMFHRETGYDTSPAFATLSELEQTSHDRTVDDDPKLIEDGCPTVNLSKALQTLPIAAPDNLIDQHQDSAISARVGNDEDPLVYDCSRHFDSEFAGVAVGLAAGDEHAIYLARVVGDLGQLEISQQSDFENGIIVPYCVTAEDGGEWCGADWVDDRVKIGVYSSFADVTQVEAWLLEALPGLVADLRWFSVADVTSNENDLQADVEISTERCDAERLTLEVAAEAYFAQNQEFPATEAVLVDAEYLRSESELYDLLPDGTVVPAPDSPCP
jgi:hypothetical protein